MRRYYTLTVVLLSAVFINAQQWEIISEAYSPSTIQDIYFISGDVGWVVGDDGVIMHTTDGGESWEKQNSGTTKSLAKVFFIDENYGWAGTGSNTTLALTGGSIVRTTDGGKNWAEVDFSSAVPGVVFTFFDGIYFVNNQTGFIIAGKSRSNYLLKTTDGGLTWTKKDSLVSTTALRWYAIEFYNENKGIIAGTAKNIQKYTTDGGETWNFSETINDNFFKDLRGVKYLSENDVIAIGDGHEYSGVPTPIYKSSDGGVTWVKKTQSPINSYGKTRGMYFKNSLEGITVGTNGYSFPHIYSTTDGGETWTLKAPFSGFAYSALTGVGDVLYALGYGGAIVKSTDFGATWDILRIKTSSPIKDITFNGSRGYVAQLYGSVIGSTDNGNNSWDFFSETGIYNIEAVSFTDENTGLIIKNNKTIVKTTDGGLTWKTVLQPESYSSRNSAVDIVFADANTGYAGMTLNENTDYHIFKTTDAGETWTDIYNEAVTSGVLNFFDANTGIKAGNNINIKITTDGGTTWNDAIVNNIPEEYLSEDASDIEIVNENTAFICGIHLLLKTTDKGNTWDYIALNDVGADSSHMTISFYNETLGYIGDFFTGVIYVTTDGGANWTKDYTFQEKYNLYCSDFNKDGEIYFGTNNGTILKWSNPSVSVENTPGLVNSYSLEQNYPNPFNPSTSISFSIAGGGLVTLKVYDVLGREAATLVNEELTAGSHSVKFNASELSSGIYFYTLTSGNYVSTRKMVLLK